MFICSQNHDEQHFLAITTLYREINDKMFICLQNHDEQHFFGNRIRKMGSCELGKKIDVFVLSPAWDKEKNLDFFFNTKEQGVITLT